MPFKGISTALITPFKQGKLDKASFLRLLDQQTKEGISQFVLASTTGENPTVSEKETGELILWFRDFEKQKNLSLKLILATGSFSTKVSVEKTKKARDLSADGVLVVVPYYNKPPQKGLIKHFEEVAKATPLPLILYNVPSRSACSLSGESIKTLSQIEGIIGIKEATGDMEFLKEIQKNVPKDFLLLSGDDPSCAEFFDLGGHGAISAGANILAKEIIEIFESPKDQRVLLFEKYKELLEELFRETNPIGVKQILQESEVISSSELRLPLSFVKNPKLSSKWKQLGKSFS